MKNKLFIMFCFLISMSACDYMDIVPPNVANVDDAFQNETEAQKALYTVYSYMPLFSNVRQNIDRIPTDEYIHEGDNYWFPFVNILTGENSATQPTANFWSHYYAWRINRPLYEGIRSGYLFLSKVDNVKGLSTDKAERWKAEVNFLIAYYHSLLLRYYGPIVIVDRLIPLDAPLEEMLQYRSPYDECVEWIVKRLNEVTPLLPVTLNPSDYGKPTQAAAKALKSRILLYAASPLFNGNAAFYADFKDKQGRHLISQEEDKEKWKLAMDAAEEAINFARTAGHSLYQRTPMVDDGFQQAVNNARYTMVDPWNSELIWGYTGWNEDDYQEDAYQCMAAARTGEGGNPYQLLAPTLSMASMYYTSRGLPIDADPGYDFENRFKSFTEIEGEQIANFNLNREPRYYASIGYDRGEYEINNTKIRLNLRYRELHGRSQTTGTDYSMSGFLVKKGIHPETVFENKDKRTLKKYPFPLARLGELYLNYIEAYVEYYGRLDQKALTYLNDLRIKNGLPKWEDVKNLATRPMTDQEVIRTERLIELAFEGHHFHDIRRWKLGEEYFNGPNYNLDINQTTPEKFWRVLQSNEKYPRVFRTPQDYLQPIYAEDIKVNPNLVQNPGY